MAEPPAARYVFRDRYLRRPPAGRSHDFIAPSLNVGRGIYAVGSLSLDCRNLNCGATATASGGATGVNMAGPGCDLPTGWHLLGAAPAYSAFAGILSGFLFLGIITLMTKRVNSDSPNGSNQAGAERPEQGSVAVNTQPPRATIDRSRSLMLFLPAFLSLLGSSFAFGLVSGEQVCARGYDEGIIASSLLAVGALGVFNGISWMLDAYGASNDDLRRTSIIITYIAYILVVGTLEIFSVYIINDAFDNEPPSYALVPLVVYGPLVIMSVVATRKWFPTDESSRARAELNAVYFPAGYVLIALLTGSLLNAYHPAEWQSLNDWKTYLVLSVALFFPAVTVVVYARSLPDWRRKNAGTRGHRIRRPTLDETDQATTT